MTYIAEPREIVSRFRWNWINASESTLGADGGWLRARVDRVAASQYGIVGFRDHLWNQWCHTFYGLASESLFLHVMNRTWRSKIRILAVVKWRTPLKSVMSVMSSRETATVCRVISCYSRAYAYSCRVPGEIGFRNRSVWIPLWNDRLFLPMPE